MARQQTQPLRCAIYTRKSSDEGLDQAFSSLQAQREACAAYIASQRHEGWQLLETPYDDGGLSGGTMARPALQRLLADIAAQSVDAVVVYKVDRLTRSLVDFARIIEAFEAQGVSFVSITQQFNTTTSMGRLTLNVLLSFAQFEREVTAERIRDKIAASRAKGMWMGGYVPLGYNVERKRLVVNPEEAATVRSIFERYRVLGCVARLKSELDARSIVSKIRPATEGKHRGGKPFSRGALYRLLANPVYIGQAVHKGKAFPGEHEPIIDDAVFAAVRGQLQGRRVTRANGARAAEPSLLGGLLVDAQGERMSPSHAVKNHKRYRYYISQALLQNRSCKTKHPTRVPAHDLETVVVAELRSLLEDQAALLDLLTSEVLDLAEQQVLLHAAARLAERWPVLSPAQLRALVQAVVARVVLREQQIDIELIPSRLRDLLQRGATDALPSCLGERCRKVILSLDVRLKRCRGATTLIVPARVAQACPSRPNPALIKKLVRAHQWFEQLRSGQASSIRQIALTEDLTGRYVARILQLAFLAPDIQEAILHGRQPPDLTIEHLRPPLPLTWSEQRRRLGFRQVPSELRLSDPPAVSCNHAPTLRTAIHQPLSPP
jgi:DNA invertase Pin-like site-specific DNA recombinase